MAEHGPPESLGLYGDGDELSAIKDVESAFGVKLNFDEAPGWFTAGDVYSSLLKVLPPDEGSKTEGWSRFARAISNETGVDPAMIVPASPLLGRGRKVPWWAIALAIGAISALAYVLNS